MDRNDLLTASRVEFLSAFVKSVEESIPQALQEISKKAAACTSSGERAVFLGARYALQSRDGELTVEMKKNMEVLLQRSFQTTYSTFRPSFSSTYNASSLSLIDTSAFEDELRIKEITNQFRNQSEEQLRDLNIRIALLFEQDNIEERENPFRPYLFARCIATAIECLGESAETSATLISQMGESMVDSIDEIYSRLNAYLAKNGVAAQLQLKISKSRTRRDLTADVAARVPNATLPNAPISGGQQFGAGQYAPSQYAPSQYSPPVQSGAPLDQKVTQLLDAIQTMVSGFANHPGMSGQGAQASAINRPTSTGNDKPNKSEWLAENQVLSDVLKKFFSSGSGASNSANAALSGTEQKIAGLISSKADSETTASATPDSGFKTDDVAATADDNARTEPDPELRNRILEFRASADGAKLTTAEQMCTDILGMLFEFILHDKQVPRMIRVQIGRLQLLVLKKALHDNSLITQTEHPMRRLIDRIATVSIGLQQLDPNIVHVTAEVQRIVDLLLADTIEDPTLLPNTLDDFELFITRELRDHPGTVNHAIQLAETAQNLSRQFLPKPSLMSQALEGLALETYLRDFLENSWMPAIAFAESSDKERGTRYRLLVPELIWSSIPKTSPEDRKQLFALLPTILNTIREGLSLVGWSALQQQDFLNWLMDIHTKALRTGNPQQISPTLFSMQKTFEKFIANPNEEQVATPVEGDLDDDRTFLIAAIKELRINVRQLDQIFEAPQQIPAVTTSNVAADNSNSGLPEIIFPAEKSTPAPQAVQRNIEERLRSGVPIEITIGAPQPGIIIYASPKMSYLLLSLASDLKPSSISVELFQNLLGSGRVRLIESEPLFERAVRSLLVSAEGMEKPVQN